MRTHKMWTIVGTCVTRGTERGCPAVCCRQAVILMVESELRKATRRAGVRVPLWAARVMTQLLFMSMVRDVRSACNTQPLLARTGRAVDVLLLLWEGWQNPYGRCCAWHCVATP